jgi:hypothetical protein
MKKTLFQRIIDREIPARIEHEDERCIVIHDIQPQAPFHLLLIPKRPIARVDEAEDSDEAVLGHLLLVARERREEAQARERIPDRDQQRAGRVRKRSPPPSSTSWRGARWNGRRAESVAGTGPGGLAAHLSHRASQVWTSPYQARLSSPREIQWFSSGKTSRRLGTCSRWR